MIELRGLNKVYGRGAGAVRALDYVSISVPAGQIFGVVGRSCAGKSTLLRTANLLERPDSGLVAIDGRDITAQNGRALRDAHRTVGKVFQHFNLLANRTVQQNVEFALEVARVPRARWSARALEMLDLVGPRDKGSAYPSLLWGGQK